MTAFVTVAVEFLNWWVTDDGGYPLFVRTAWAVVRSLGFLLLIWQVQRGRASAPPFALILSVTTLFALGRLVVPRHGMPNPVGLAGFLIVGLLCTAVLLLFYRSPAVADYLKQHANRLVVTRKGIDWRPVPPKRAPVPGWLLTARIAALSYSPLMLVGAAVAIGQIFDGQIDALPAVVLWFGAAFAVSFATVIVTLFLLKGKPWATRALVLLSLAVLAIDLPLCWLLLGSDGLVRDGIPLIAATLLTFLALYRARATR